MHATQILFFHENEKPNEQKQAKPPTKHAITDVILAWNDIAQLTNSIA